MPIGTCLHYYIPEEQMKWDVMFCTVRKELIKDFKSYVASYNLSYKLINQTSKGSFYEIAGLQCKLDLLLNQLSLLSEKNKRL